MLFALGILLMSLVSMGMYRTIMMPLEKIEKAATIIGRGNLDYKVKIEKKNEFQFIAKAMNQMASDLKEFHIKMAQMGKMAAIGELAGGVAHEINNPLTGILGNVQILMKKYAPETEESELLKKMERASLRCRNIVSDLLDFSRKEEQEKSDQDMNKVLEDTFSFCETEILSKNIELIKNYSSNLPAIKAAPRSLQQAFLNIISNAIQSMPEGGRLSVTTDLLRKNSIKYVRVDIKDTGIGFGEETAAHMFDPFFTTREVGEGTGLGLSLTYRIIKNHKGELKAHSPGPGKGALLTAIFQV